MDGDNSMILIVQTGGTIDKDYPRTAGGYAFEITTDPAAQRILERSRARSKVRYVTACAKDSQEMTRGDRDTIVQLCKAADEQSILITHGTCAMIETAMFLKSKEELDEKTIVLTGAFRPERFKDSDADFNIGFALGALSALRASQNTGIYLCMNGVLLPAMSSGRNETTGLFDVKAEGVAIT